MSTNQDFNIDDLEESLQSDVNQMLLAYETGWTERGIDDKKKFQDRVKINVANTVDYIKQVVTQLRKLELSVNGAYIKLERANSLSVIITVPVNTFMDEKLLQVYSFTHDIERHSRSDDYRVAFSITYNEGDLDQDALLSDGFFGLMKPVNE